MTADMRGISWFREYPLGTYANVIAIEGDTFRDIAALKRRQWSMKARETTIRHE